MSSSRSKAGTRKTTSSINHDSPKYVQRSDAGRTVHGSKAAGTDGAHYAGFGLVNAIGTHMPGRPRSEESKQQLIRQLNSSSNMSVTTAYNNRTVHERQDARIASAYVNDQTLQGASTVARAARAYQSLSSMDQAQAEARALGNMRYHDPTTGGYPMVKNAYDRRLNL